METILVSVITSALITTIICKILAVYTFEVIDDYVKNMIDVAKKLVRDAHFDK